MAKYKKRPDGRYLKQITIGINPDGKPKKKTLYGRTIAELEERERDFRNLVEKGISVSTENITVNELIGLFKKRKKKSVGDSTYRTIERDMNKLSDVMGFMKVKDVRIFHLEDFIDNISEKSKESTIRGLVLRVKEVFRFALEKDMIYKNPAEFIAMPKLPESNKRMLTDHEKEIFDSAELNAKERCFVSILKYTGMRRGEALALSVSDIDLKKNTITINKTLSDGRGHPFIQPNTKTKAGMRTIPIFEPLRPILEGYCSDRIGLLFTRKNGSLYNSEYITRLWNDIMDKLKIIDKDLAADITPHIFRHTFASDLYDAGIDIKRAQYILGHANARTTLDVYTHFDKLNLKVDEMDNYYRQSKDSQQHKNNA